MFWSFLVLHYLTSFSSAINAQILYAFQLQVSLQNLNFCFGDAVHKISLNVQHIFEGEVLKYQNEKKNQIPNNGSQTNTVIFFK